MGLISHNVHYYKVLSVGWIFITNLYVAQFAKTNFNCNLHIKKRRISFSFVEIYN